MSSYYDKYIKYKNKYLNLKNTFKDYNKNYYPEAPHDKLVIIRIPKGTIWFRSMPDACEYKSSNLIKFNLKKNPDYNTNNGMYLGNRAILSIAMCIEYNKLQEFGIFEVLEDIYVVIVKYIPANAYTGEPSNVFTGELDDSYFRNIYPMEDKEYRLLSREKELELDRTGGASEIFLTEKDANKIKEIYTFKFNPEIIKSVDDLSTYLELNDYPFDFEKYIDDKILIESDCPRVKVNGEINLTLPEFKRVFVSEKEGIVTSSTGEFFKNVLFNDNVYAKNIPSNQISFLFNKETQVPANNYADLAGIPMKQPRKKITFTGGALSNYE